MSRRPAVAAVGLLCLGALTACGAGQQAQTYQKHSYEFANVDQGDVAIRGVAIDAVPGSSGVIAKGTTLRVTGSFLSQGSGDSLTGASSSVASSVTLEQDGKPVPQIDVPVSGRTGNWNIVLTGTTRDLRGGSYVDVTLDFAKAGRTTVQVPVRSGSSFINGAGQADPGPTVSPAAPPSEAAG